MNVPDVRDFIEPAVDAAGHDIGSVRLHCGKRTLLLQLTSSMSGQWQYREIAKVLQPILDKVFKEGRRSAAGEKHAGTSRSSARIQ